MDRFDNDPPTATLVAIAKDEGPYLLEWIAFHLAIGFSQIVVYDNGSTDDTTRILKRLSSRHDQISTVFWPSGRLHLNDSPQTTAYSHALGAVWTDWVMFLDIDEFLVPFTDGSLQSFLSRVPSAAGSVHINWRGFGSSGVARTDYGLVTTTFTRCASGAWSNNHHFKSLARTRLAAKASIHDIETSAGVRLLSDLEEFETLHGGHSNRIVHAGIQINHYQCKTYDEFNKRMNRGDANYHPSHALKQRDDSLLRFQQLDQNDCEDYAILLFHNKHLVIHSALQQLL